MQRRITDHSTQFMHIYQFIDRMLKSTQASALVLDKLALLVLSTNIPRILAVSQRQHILHQFESHAPALSAPQPFRTLLQHTAAVERHASCIPEAYLVRRSEGGKVENLDISMYLSTFLQ